MENCGDCHRMPTELIESIDTQKECDHCHNPVYGSVKLAAASTDEKSHKGGRPEGY